MPLCYFCSYHNTKVVMLCVGITAVVCLGVTLFCFQTKVSQVNQKASYTDCMINHKRCDW